MNFWDSLSHLPSQQLLFFVIALVVAFGFEFINGFHDTANAVTTVIYTHSLKPTQAVIFSGICNFLGVLLGGTAVAFSIVHLLPVDLLVNSSANAALVMVLSLLLAGVMWNLGTWYYGLPVSSSHALIGSILGVGIANGVIAGNGLAGVNWAKATDVGIALLVSPMIGFVASAMLLLMMKRVFKEPKLYEPANPDQPTPPWIRRVLIATCGGVSFAHGSNDGQKGMGLILLVLIGFLPVHYALDLWDKGEAARVHEMAVTLQARHTAENREIPAQLQDDLGRITRDLHGLSDFSQLPADTNERWELRRAILRVAEHKEYSTAEEQRVFRGSIEFVPLWVVIGVALALGIGTTIGYKRIVITVAEKIGKTHLAYGQGAAAEVVAAVTIIMADVVHAPVSTTHVLSSGIAGTMWANKSGIQGATVRKIAVAWLLTLPCAVILSAGLYTIGRALFT